MSKVEKLFPDMKGTFNDQIQFVESSTGRITLKVMGMEITFGRAVFHGKPKIMEISRKKETRISDRGSLGIPKDIYRAAFARAAAMLRDQAEIGRKPPKNQDPRQTDLF